MDQQTQETGTEHAASFESAPDKIGREYHELLPCKMTDADRLEKSARLTKLLSQIESKQEAMDDAKKRARLDIEKDELEVKKITLELNTGKADKPVLCQEQLYYRVGLVREVRTDTGQVIDEHAMAVEDRQPSLFNGDGADRDDDDSPADDYDGGSPDSTRPAEDRTPPNLATSKPRRGSKR
jgi:hypothetical protein